LLFRAGLPSTAAGLGSFHQISLYQDHSEAAIHGEFKCQALPSRGARCTLWVLSCQRAVRARALLRGEGTLTPPFWCMVPDFPKTATSVPKQTEQPYLLKWHAASCGDRTAARGLRGRGGWAVLWGRGTSVPPIVAGRRGRCIWWGP